MRAFRFLNVAILSALVAGSAALYAQDEKPQEEPKKQEEPRPEPKSNEMKPAKQQDEMKPPKQEEAKPSKQEKQDQKQEQKEQRQSHDQMKAGDQQHGQPGKSARIPDDKFRSNFGRSHTFVVSRPVIVEGQPRFQYGGYSFVIIDAWPADWAYTDDCYIDYVDGEYFLFDLLHPGVRIALTVVL
jgi:hypothetical protein